MSNTVFAILDICILIVLSGLSVFIFWIKRKNKSPKNNTLGNLQQTFELQDEIIYHSSQALITVSHLLRTISYIFSVELSKISQTTVSQEIALAFKEVAHRVSSHISNEDSNYSYTLIVGDCFASTENCLLVLDKILKNYNNTTVDFIVRDFKHSLNN